MSSAALESVTAVIAAAGSGERLGVGGPKAFLPLAGRPMIEWSLDACREAGVGSIVVACPPGHAYESSGNEPHGSDPPRGSAPLTPVPIRIVDGGATRAASVANALAVVETELVAIHDAARPMLTAELLRGVVASLEADPGAAGAIAATPVTDTIKRTAGRNLSSTRPGGLNSGLDIEETLKLEVEETLERAALWAAQTPQVFRAEALRAALEAATEPGSATDEAMLVERAGERVLVHPAAPENLKVTTLGDLELAELLLSRRQSG